MVDKIQKKPLAIEGKLQQLQTRKDKIHKKIQDTWDDQLQKPCANVLCFTFNLTFHLVNSQGCSNEWGRAPRRVNKNTFFCVPSICILLCPQFIILKLFDLVHVQCFHSTGLLAGRVLKLQCFSVCVCLSVCLSPSLPAKIVVTFLMTTPYISIISNRYGVARAWL